MRRDLRRVELLHPRLQLGDDDQPLPQRFRHLDRDIHPLMRGKVSYEEQEILFPVGERKHSRIDAVVDDPDVW